MIDSDRDNDVYNAIVYLLDLPETFGTPMEMDPFQIAMLKNLQPGID